ncbi:hypothetical protein D3C85_1931500 [compost metagenome]
MLLDALKGQSPADQKCVTDALVEHFGDDVYQLETSFEGMERVFLLGVPGLAQYWLSMKSDV